MHGLFNQRIHSSKSTIFFNLKTHYIPSIACSRACCLLLQILQESGTQECQSSSDGASKAIGSN